MAKQETKTKTGAMLDVEREEEAWTTGQDRSAGIVEAVVGRGCCEMMALSANETTSRRLRLLGLFHGKGNEAEGKQARYADRHGRGAGTGPSMGSCLLLFLSIFLGRETL